MKKLSEKDKIKITEIPKIIFEEIGEKLKLNKKVLLPRVTLRGVNYLQIRLTDKDNRFSGIMGFGVKNFGDGCSFVFALWGIRPRILENPILKIESGPRKTGRWSLGLGFYIKEICEINFSSGDFDLENPAMKIVPKILDLALMLNSKSFGREFWEKDMHPDWDFNCSPM